MQLNLDAAKSFLQSLQNGDGGFGNKNGLASDVESTKCVPASSIVRAAPRYAD